MTYTFNPYLKQQGRNAKDTEGGAGYIEHPDDKFMNIVWQTRDDELSEYEVRLSEALSEAFSDGAASLSEVVDSLNDSGIAPSDDAKWTDEVFCAEMARLAGRANTGGER